MRGSGWMILAPVLLLATAAYGEGDTSHDRGETVTSTAPHQRTEDDQKLVQMSQDLKKQCDGLSGTFNLTDASAKHEAAPLGHNTEGRLGSGKVYGENSHPNGGTAYQASGMCKTTITLDFAHPPPKP